MKKILLFSVLAGTIFFTSCKSKKNKQVQETDTIEVVEVVEAEVFADAVKTDEGVKLTFSADLLFATDSYTLTDKEKEDLDNLAKLLKKTVHKRKGDFLTSSYSGNSGI